METGVETEFEKNNAETGDISIQKEIRQGELKSIWQLIRESFSVYRLKMRGLSAVMLVPVGLNFIFQLALIFSVRSEMLSQSMIFSFVKIILWVGSFYFGTIASLALVYFIISEIDVREAYRKAISNSFSYIVLLGLMASLVLLLTLFLVILTSFFAKMFPDSGRDFWKLVVLFLAIPIYGIIYTYLSLAIFEFAFAEKKGIEAIWRSRKMVAGIFWQIFWRLFGFALVGALVLSPVIIGAYFLNDKHKIIIGFVQIFSVPFSVIFGILLYKNVLEIKNDLVIEAPKKGILFLCYLGTAMIVPILFIALCFKLLHLSAYDIANPDDSKMQLSVVNIPKEQNAFYILKEAENKIYWPKEEIDEKGISDGLTNRILAGNREALDCFEKGVALPFYQQPELQDPKNYRMDLVIGSMNFLRNLARINSLQAQIIFKEGREKEAFNQVLKTIKMGQMLQDGQGSLVVYLIGMSTKELGLNDFRLMLKYSHLPTADLLEYTNELNKYKESKLSLQKAFKAEYLTMDNFKENIVSAIFRGEEMSSDSSLGMLMNVPGSRVLASNSFYCQPNRAKLILMEDYGRLVSNAEKNNYSEVEQREMIMIDPVKFIFTSNAVAKILSNHGTLALYPVCSKKFQENASFRETQLLLAIKAYRQDNGSLPKSLNELVPKYIPELMNDPFDGKPLRYSQEKKMIYSVGEDLIDNGGEISKENWNDGKDLGFEIEF